MSIYIHLIIASVFWGLNVVVMKLLLEYIPFLMLASLRVLLSFVCLFIYLKLKRYTIHRVNLKKIILISMFGIYFNFLFTFYGMQEVKGVDNALINALSPIITLCISGILLHKEIKRYEMIAVVLSIFAFLLSIDFRLFSLRLGFYLMFAGMICYMISHVLMRKWNIRSSLSYTYYQLGLGFLFLVVHTVVLRQFKLSFLAIPILYWLLFIVVSGVGFAYIQVVYMNASERIGVLKTSFFLSLNPIVTYVASIFILKEDLDYIHVISFMLLIISIYIVNLKKN